MGQACESFRVGAPVPANSVTLRLSARRVLRGSGLHVVAEVLKGRRVKKVAHNHHAVVGKRF